MSSFKNISGGTLFLQGPGSWVFTADKDETVESCNYFKRFTAEGGATEAAGTLLLELVSDDGSEWSRHAIPNNTYIWHSTVSAGTSYDANVCHLATLLGGDPAEFCQIYTSAACKCKINGNADSILNLKADSYQVFNVNELLVSTLAFDATGSGATDVVVEVMGANTVKCWPSD